MVPREMSQFLEDSCVLRDVKGHHVQSLLGLLLEQQSITAVWPLADNFSLKAFITNEENVSDAAKNPPS